MHDRKKILGIVGSYRKGSIIDSAVSQVLASAEQCGAETSKIYLTDQQIEFCTNCRSCTQEPGPIRGQCVLEDDMESILEQIDGAQGLVLGSPVNFDNVTAVTRRFLERLVRYVYWPWEKMIPVLRNKKKSKKAVLVTSSAAPAFVGRLMMHSVSALKKMAGVLGAKPIGTLYVGMVCGEEPKLPAGAVKKAAALGRKLAF